MADRLGLTGGAVGEEEVVVVAWPVVTCWWHEQERDAIRGRWLGYEDWS